MTRARGVVVEMTRNSLGGFHEQCYVLGLVMFQESTNKDLRLLCRANLYYSYEENSF